MNIDVAKLKENTNDNAAASAIFRSFLNRKRDRENTDLRQYHVRLQEAGVVVSFDDVIKVFKELDRAGAGSLILGRGGNHHRFKWDYSLRSLGKAIESPDKNTPVRLISSRVHRVRQRPIITKPTKTPTIPKATPVATSIPVSTLVAVYPLRGNFRIRLTLPGDLSRSEATALGEFIASLTST